MRKPKKSKKKVKKVNPGIIPKDYADLIRLWDHRIEVAIRKFKMSEEEYEDLKQDIYTEFLARDYMGKIYNPKKGGAFSTFFYSFINTRALRRGCKVTAVKQKFVSNLDLDPVSSDPSNLDESQEHGSIDSKAVEYITPNEKIFWESGLNNIFGRLLHPSLVNGYVLKKTSSGYKLVERSLFNLFKLLKDGWAKDEIAEEMSYSSNNIIIMLQRLRTIPEMIRLRETYHDISSTMVDAVLPQGTLEF